MKMTRRSALKLSMASLSASFLSFSGCRSDNTVRHILPSVTPTQFSISVSLKRSATELALEVDGRNVGGRQMDSKGRFWSFQIDGLNPNTEYQLRLNNNENLTEVTWPLRTFPNPQDQPENFHLLLYTCAGGADGFGLGGRQFFKPHTFRQKLFDEAIAKDPHAAVALGDQIYWDLRGEELPPVGRRSKLIKVLAGWYLRVKYGSFDRTKELIGTENETVLTRIGDEQIANLYGTRFRSIPMFFVSDDHDYFENDDAEEDLVTFPPDQFSKAAHDAIAALYYPPLPAGPSGERDHAFGSIRYGQLFEAPLFDCAGYLTLDGEDAGLVPPHVEEWLINRALHSPARHFAYIPSHPFGWTAGKWREWYPDMLAPPGFTGVVSNSLMDENVSEVMTTEAQKYLWPEGWWIQHQRLLSAIAGRDANRMILSGDIHAQGAVSIHRSGQFHLEDSPILSALVGPVGTSDATWPSAARGVVASEPGWLETTEQCPTKEVNGFSMLYVEHSSARLELFDCGGYDRSLGEDGSVQSVISLDIS